jgi:hypothetical protein
MIRPKAAIIVTTLGLMLMVYLLPAQLVWAQSAKADFSFDNFAGTYHLDRDSKGVATLTVQEDMVVEFPLNGNCYGIKRAIPEKYQGHDLNLKIISVTDVGGTPVNYRTYADGQGNEIIETGDKDITLSGIQSYQINYQTSGVVAFNPDSDEFLVNVNGRGWQESFKSVKAFIHISKAFTADLISKPTCYIGYQNETLNKCTLATINETDGSLINVSTTQPLTAHQALLVNLNFKKGTFQQKKPTSKVYLVVESILAALLSICGAVLLIKYLKDRE